MFPRSKRLSRTQIQVVLQHGRRISSKNFTLFFSEREHGYTVIVSKKHVRFSVARHLLKRRIYNILRTKEGLPLSLIVMVRAPIAISPHHMIQEELTTLLSKI